MPWQLQYTADGSAIHVDDIVITRRGLEGRVTGLRVPSGQRNDPGALFIKWLDPHEVDRPTAVYSPAVLDASYVEITDEAQLREELAHALLQQQRNGLGPTNS